MANLPAQPPMTPGVFVIGTDTGVGKTTVSIGIVAACTAAGMRVAVMKPCETGSGDDAARLLAATGRVLDPELVNPYRYNVPASPDFAARHEGRAVSMDVIRAAFARLSSDADFTLVEGAGGLLVPLTPTATIADLAAMLGLPVVIVARSALGTINHTLLTLEAARNRRLHVLGVIFVRTTTAAGAEEADSVDMIQRLGPVRSLGWMPCIDDAAHQSPAVLGMAVRQHVNLHALLAGAALGAITHE